MHCSDVLKTKMPGALRVLIINFKNPDWSVHYKVTFPQNCQLFMALEKLQGEGGSFSCKNAIKLETLGALPVFIIDFNSHDWLVHYKMRPPCKLHLQRCQGGLAMKPTIEMLSA